MKTNTTKASETPVAAIDWVAPDIKPPSQWESGGVRVSDVRRRNIDFHYRMPLWLAMPVAEAEKLRVTRIAMALTTTTTEAAVASAASGAAVASDGGTYVRDCRDGGAGAGAPWVERVVTVTWLVAMVVACLTATGCQHIEPPPSAAEVPLSGLLTQSEATKSPEAAQTLSQLNAPAAKPVLAWHPPRACMGLTP